MPWTGADAYGHTHKAKSDKEKEMWAAVANSALSTHDEATAVRMANGVVKKRKKQHIKAP